jgi:hypothetical protein
MRKTILFFAIIFSITPAFAQQKKELDIDVNYDESNVPKYNLPELLISAEGNTISSADDWINVRRPQILSLFGNLVYGQVPHPENPVITDITMQGVNKDFMEGKGTRKEILISFSNEKGTAEMTILVFVPNKASKPVPAFMFLTNDHPKSVKVEVDPNFPNRLRNGWPIGEILDRGYAFISVYQNDLIGLTEVDYSRGIQELRGIQSLFFKDGQSFPKANEWGVLAIWGWGAMRALDYLETDEDVDHKKVALMGHSKNGKATLWAAAQDERFAMAISAQSGCAGAALFRRRYGETLAKMVTRIPYWLCLNAWKFVNMEDDLPVDQHMLLALIAPRPVYVASGIEDTWADPRGEYLSAYHASKVYRLLGKSGLTSEDSPPIGEAIIESNVGYHIRAGGHSVEMYDWQRFLEFADYHLKR